MDHRSIGADLLKLPEQAILPFPMKMEEEEITEAEIEEIERAKEEQKKRELKWLEESSVRKERQSERPQ
jgi:hypothetical protein